MLDNYFNYKKHKTDFKTEVIAGTTTFLTMAYIMFLNPFILSGEFAGPEKGFFDFGAVYTATILATALACFIMAFYGKLKIYFIFISNAFDDHWLSNNQR